MKRQVMMLVALVMVLPMATVMAFHPTTTSCSTCHIVHNSQSGGDVPLWSGQTIDPETTFIMYSSDTLDATKNGNPAGSTLLCLSCHDNSTSSRHAMNTADGDMSRTHPIEITYDAALLDEDDELRDPSEATVIRSDGEGGTIAEELLGGGDTVNCMSCHDVHVQGLHEDTNTDLPADPLGEGDYDMPHLQDIEGVEFAARGSDPEFSDFSLKYGALCVTCHIK